MGKAANRKRDRKQAASVATTQAIQKAQNGVMDDMLIVMHLMASIESNDLPGFQSAVKNLEASGSDLFHFEIKLIEGNDPAKDMSLLHYAIYMGAEDIVAWIIRRGVTAGDVQSLTEFQGMMSVLTFGGDGTEDFALIQRLCLKALRPDTAEEAKQNLADAHAAMQKASTPKPGLMLMAQAASDFLVSQGLQPHVHADTGSTAATSV